MRHHVLESGLQKAVKRAAKQAGIDKKVGCHTLRHYAEFPTMPSNQISPRNMKGSVMISSA